MFKSIMITALFLVLGFSASAQDYTAQKVASFVDGTGLVTNTAPWMTASGADTTEFIYLEDHLSSDASDTLFAIAISTTADTAQCAWKVNFYANNKLLGSTVADSLVYGFNTDKTTNIRAMNLYNIRPAGTTAIKVVSTASANYNKDGDEGRLNIGLITK